MNAVRLARAIRAGSGAQRGLSSEVANQTSQAKQVGPLAALGVTIIPVPSSYRPYRRST